MVLRAGRKPACHFLAFFKMRLTGRTVEMWTWKIFVRAYVVPHVCAEKRREKMIGVGEKEAWGNGLMLTGLTGFLAVEGVNLPPIC